MTPFADLHCHLLAGLDDGPKTIDDALEMCRIAYDEGTRHITAGAHFNSIWQNRPDDIRPAAEKLRQALIEHDIPIKIYPNTEVALYPELMRDWLAGDLLGYNDQRHYLLIEFPHNIYVDIKGLVEELIQHETRPVLAHAERYSQLVHGGNEIDQLVELGCLIQVNTGSITRPTDSATGTIVKEWVQRGLVHVLGSDGHSKVNRPPHFAEAFQQVVRWTDQTQASLIASTNGLMVLRGLNFQPPTPQPRRRKWFSFLGG